MGACGPLQDGLPLFSPGREATAKASARVPEREPGAREKQAAREKRASAPIPCSVPAVIVALVGAPQQGERAALPAAQNEAMGDPAYLFWLPPARPALQIPALPERQDDLGPLPVSAEASYPIAQRRRSCSQSVLIREKDWPHVVQATGEYWRPAVWLAGHQGLYRCQRSPSRLRGAYSARFSAPFLAEAYPQQACGLPGARL